MASYCPRLCSLWHNRKTHRRRNRPPYYKLFLNDVPTTLDELENTLKEKVALDPDVPVLVRGDERLEYGEVMDVVKVVYKCQVRKMALVTVEK